VFTTEVGDGKRVQKFVPVGVTPNGASPPP
jgi:hypothetical protein